MASRLRRALASWAFAAGLLAVVTGVQAADEDQAAPLAAPVEEPDNGRGFYLTGGFGQTDYRVAQDGGRARHESGWGGRAMLGYQFVRWLRVEVGAVKLAQGWETDPAIAVVGAWHLADRFALTMRLGKYRRSTPRTDTFFFGGKTENDSEIETTLGGGIEWYLQPRLSLMLTQESFESSFLNDSRGAAMTSLSVRYRF